MPLIERKNMVDLNEKLSLSKQCILLNINRNYFYFSPKVEGSENLLMMELLKKQYHATPFYGYRKMTVWFERDGFEVNENRVRRLMKVVSWQTIYREPHTTIAVKEHKKYTFLLKELKITQRNLVWATDITYIPIDKSFMSLCAIIDLHTRYVLSWDVSNTMTAEWCKGVLQEAIDKNGKPQIFNPHQGSQYNNEVHSKLLISSDIKISVDGQGRAIDNIFVERLWRTVKYKNL